jgi:hypothetical protein
MKSRLILTSAVLIFTFYLKSQIIISNSYFPVKGDSLKYYTDDNPANFDLSVQGGNQLWDFSGLVKKNPSFRAFTDAKMCDVDKKFTDAELCETANGFSTFYNVSTTVFEKIGEQGELNQGLPIPNATRYTPAQIERRAPMKFFDVKDTKYNQNFSFSTSFLPDSLLGQLGGLFDSLRFKIAGSRIDVVDGWGSCTIPGGTFNVLREKRTDTRDTKIEVHTLFGWIDISTVLGGGGQGGSLLEAIGKDTIITYNFFNDKAKEEIAIVTLDNRTMKATEVRFKAIGSPTATQFDIFASALFKIMPNPVVGNGKIYFKNFAEDRYTVEFTSAVTGQKVSEKMTVYGNTIWDFSTLDLPKGLIICKIFPENGSMVAMQKFISL